jgi:hypothetical protein
MRSHRDESAIDPHRDRRRGFIVLEA